MHSTFNCFNDLTFRHTIMKKTDFENADDLTFRHTIMKKTDFENAAFIILIKHFLPFPQCFSKAIFRDIC